MEKLKDNSNEALIRIQNFLKLCEEDPERYKIQTNADTDQQTNNYKKSALLKQNSSPSRDVLGEILKRYDDEKKEIQRQYEERFQKMQNEREKNLKEIVVLNITIQNYQKKLDDLILENKENVEKIHTLEKIKQDFEELLETQIQKEKKIDQNFVQIQQKYQDMEKFSNIFQNNVVSCQEFQNQLTEKMKTYEKAQSDHMAQFKEILQKKKVLEEDIVQKEALLNQHDSQKSAYEKEIQMKQDMLEKKMLECNELKKKAEDLKSDLSEIRKQLHSHLLSSVVDNSPAADANSNSDLKKAQDLQKKIETLEKINKTLEKKLQEITSENNNFKITSQNLRQQLDEGKNQSKRDIDSYEDRIKALTETISQISLEKTGKQKENHQKTEVSHEIKFSEEISKLNVELSTKDTKLHELVEMKNNIEVENKHLSNFLNSKTDSFIRSEMEVDSLRKEISQLKLQFEHLQQENSNLKKQQEKAKDELSIFEKNFNLDFEPDKQSISHQNINNFDTSMTAPSSDIKEIEDDLDPLFQEDQDPPPTARFSSTTRSTDNNSSKIPSTKSNFSSKSASVNKIVDVDDDIEDSSLTTSLDNRPNVKKSGESEKCSECGQGCFGLMTNCTMCKRVFHASCCPFGDDLFSNYVCVHCRHEKPNESPLKETKKPVTATKSKPKKTKLQL